MLRLLRLSACALVGAFLLAAVTGRADAGYGKYFLYSFRGGADGNNPYSALVTDSQGNFYGTTAGGGAAGRGTVFSLTPDGTKTVLHSFIGGAKDGADPLVGLAIDKDGNLYGTTAYGGNSQEVCSGGCGTVFKIAPGGAETLYSFPGATGAYPYASLILDRKGNLYGTTQYGGDQGGYGTVFKLAPNGTETVLHSFGYGDGAYPEGSLIRDKQGNLYGTTYGGGGGGFGAVFELSPDGTLSVLHDFTNGSDGGEPFAGVIEDSAGNLYGTTFSGGADGVGTVFMLGPDGTETVLYNFTGGKDGAGPEAALLMDRSGRLYGTTAYGGEYGAGNVFRLTPNGSERSLVSFVDSAFPSGAVIVRNGYFYGTTFGGGGYGYGGVFQLQE